MRKRQVEDRPFLFLLQSTEDPDSSVLEVFGSEQEARRTASMDGFLFRVERLERNENGTYAYGNERFIGPVCIHEPAPAQETERGR